MSAHVTVEPGDTLTSLAAEHGFLDADEVWQAPENEALRAQRNPDLLVPGDVLFIPDKQPRTVSVQTGQRRTIVVERTTVKLRLLLRDLLGAPRAGVTCELVVDGTPHTVTSAGDGLIEVEIDAGAREARLTLDGVEQVLQIGWLTPADTAAGAAARLRNLGYLVEADDDEAAVKLAVELFQVDHQLPVDGQWRSITAKLVEIHGV